MKNFKLVHTKRTLFYSKFQKSKEFFKRKDFISFEKQILSEMLELTENPVEIPKTEFATITEMYDSVGKAHVFKENPIYKVLQFASYYYEKMNKVEEAIEFQHLAEKKCPVRWYRGLIKINIGTLYLRNGDYQKSLEYFLNGVQDTEDNINEENYSHVAFAHLNIGKYFLTLDKDLAKEHLEKAYTLRENFFGYKHSETLESGLLLSKILIELEKIDQAIFTLEKVLIAMDVSTQNLEMLVDTGLLLARAYGIKKRYTQQQNILTRIFHIIKRNKNKNPEDVEWYQYKIDNMLGSCKVLKDEVNLANFLFQKIVEIEYRNYLKWNEKYGADFEKELGKRHFYYGIALFKNKKFDKAIEEFQRGYGIYHDKLKDEKFAKVLKEYIDQCQDLKIKN